MTLIPDAEIAAIEKRLAEATPGPWEAQPPRVCIPLPTPEEVTALAEGGWEKYGFPISKPARYIDAMLPSEAEEFGEECFIAGFEAAYRRLGEVGK